MTVSYRENEISQENHMEWVFSYTQLEDIAIAVI